MDYKEYLIAMVSIFLFFALLFGTIMYSETLKYECRNIAAQKNMPASDIQAVCK